MPRHMATQDFYLPPNYKLFVYISVFIIPCSVYNREQYSSISDRTRRAGTLFPYISQRAARYWERSFRKARANKGIRELETK